MATKKGPKKKMVEAPQMMEKYDDRPTLYANENQVKFSEDPDLKQKVELTVEAELTSVSLMEYGDNKGKKEYRFRINNVKLKEKEE